MTLSNVLAVISAFAQLGLLAVAVTAAILTRKQIKFNTYYQLLFYLQNQDLRIARRDSYLLAEKNKSFKEWDDKEKMTVSTVFSSFDFVGLLASQSLFDLRLIADPYQDAIISTFEKHRDFLNEEREKKKNQRYWYFVDHLYNTSIALRNGQTKSILYK